MSVATRSNRKSRQGFGAFESSGALGIDHIGSISFAHSAAVNFWVTFVHNCVQPPKPTVMSDDLTISGPSWMMGSSRSNERRRSNPS